MSKILFVLVLVFVADSLSQTIILPTWRPPPTEGPVIRTARDVGDDEPLWLYQGDNIDRAPATGDHPYLPNIIDDIKLDPNRRYARSLDSPSSRRSSGSRASSGSRDTGPTHPGYNRRNARSVPTPGDAGNRYLVTGFNPRYQPFLTGPEKPRPLKAHAQ